MAGTFSDEDVRERLSTTRIGGGEGYTRPDYSDDEIDELVSTLDGLKDALDSNASTIAIAARAEIETGDTVLDAGDKTIIGEPGATGDDRPLLYTDFTGQTRNIPWKSGRRPYTMFYSEESPRFEGVRIRGALPEGPFIPWDDNVGLSRGITAKGPEIELENVEVRGFTWCNVHIRGELRNGNESDSLYTQATIENCDLSDTFQSGYGYGVDHRRGFSEISECYFNANRHSVCLFGWSRSGYVVEDCVFGPWQRLYPIDAHCLSENNSGVSNQNAREWELRAGGRIEVRNCTFLFRSYGNDEAEDMSRGAVVCIRGVPYDGVEIERNRMLHSGAPNQNVGNSGSDEAIIQKNLTLSSFPTVETDDRGFRDVSWSENQFGAGAPYRAHIGADCNLDDPHYGGPIRGDEERAALAKGSRELLDAIRGD